MIAKATDLTFAVGAIPRPKFRTDRDSDEP